VGRAAGGRAESGWTLIVGAAVFVLLVGVLAWRIVVVRSNPAVTNAPRAAEQTYLRLIAQRVELYARTYHRPAYSLDSVSAHLDSTNARLMRDLRRDLWGHPVEYAWTRCGFTLQSRGGSANRAVSSAEERAGITERFSWPATVRPDTGCT